MQKERTKTLQQGWADKYIGMPYKSNGRDSDGLDCWGLVRLVYEQELGINLPSFSSDYNESDTDRIQELIAQYKEGWSQADKPKEGTVVLFRVKGTESHVGIAISETQFIHSREGKDVAVENFTSAHWSRRIVGYFEYSENKSLVLNARPHPLKTQNVSISIPTGTTLAEVVRVMQKEYDIQPELKSKVIILLNGNVIPEEEYSNIVLSETDTVEYRAVARGGDTLRMVAFMVVAYYAPYLATYALQGAGVAAAAMGTTLSYTAGAAIYYGAQIATVMVGSALINAIAPVRPPTSSTPNDPGSSEKMLMVTGAANQIKPYEAIPIVLGRTKITPPLGSNSFLNYSSERNMNVNMLLVWGYGPLFLDEATLKVGNIPLVNYQNYNIKTLDGRVAPTVQEQATFDGIYGNDYTQNQVNIDLVVAGNPNTAIDGDWVESASTGKVDELSVSLHFPQGLRKVNKTSGDSAGIPISFELEYSINNGAWTPWKVLTLPASATKIVTKYNSVWNNFFETYEDIPYEVSETYYPSKKDAFTYTESIAYPSLPDNTSVMVRIRRKNGSDNDPSDGHIYYTQSIFQLATFKANNKPISVDFTPVLAKTALSIQATDQLNGQLEGINGICQTYCPSWNGTSWVDAATNNPADLFRYVLTHPANPRPVTDIANKINLAQLQYWHSYCTAKEFTYNSVLGSQRSILEVLRDICAAGRASPAMVDGKWTVIIDEAKGVTQHFSPHNSWGFEGTKALPKFPDGLRVTYYDEDQDFQQAEIIVYNIGKSKSNSSLFESIQLPGVTKKSLVIDHARWHMAQAKLRPEVYTLNTDIEYIVCNRGDRVKVMHDVPMWGIGSGRIKNKISQTRLELDEPLVYNVGTSYTIRIRGSDGRSTVRNITNFVSDTIIDVDSDLKDDEAFPLDLFLFGELNTESQDLIVLNIEPTSNKSARLTLVDYGVTDTYNIFTDYDKQTSPIVFESQITLPAKNLINSFGDKTPTITKIVSNESVMERISSTVFRYNIAVSFVNAMSLPVTTEGVEVQYTTGDTLQSQSHIYKSVFVGFNDSFCKIPDVVEGENYSIRARYVGTDGRTGKWTAWENHSVVGRRTPPSDVTGFTIEADGKSNTVLFSWNPIPDVDIAYYEIRELNQNWINDNEYIYRGDAHSFTYNYPAGQPTQTYYIRAIDNAGKYSRLAASATFDVTSPKPVLDINHVFADTSLTNASVTISWVKGIVGSFTIDHYHVKLTKPLHAPLEFDTYSNTATVDADWVGSAMIEVTTHDVVGYTSDVTTGYIQKFLPNPINQSTYKAQVIDNNVLLYWDYPAQTSLPISHARIKRGATWNTATLVGDKSGTFTSISELQAGNYQYWIAVVDTDNNESTPISLAVQVAQPPNFIFNAEYPSTFSGTISNAYVETNGSLTLPVNLTETFAGHFTSNGWSTPQDQINAGYPYYAQPGLSSGYYEEVFNYGTPLSSSQITLNYSGTNISGTPTIIPTISIGTYNVITDSIDWIDYGSASSIFATNFQYVKVRITVNQSTAGDLYNLTSLLVRLDAKQKSDSLTVYADAMASDTTGTIVNLATEFADISSISLTPKGTVPLTAVYSFFDTVLTGTYSITSNVMTVDTAGHNLIEKQNVRLYFSSGSALNGVYTVASVIDANLYTVNTTQPDTTGNVTSYPNSFLVYVFDSNGDGYSTNVSWQVTGY